MAATLGAGVRDGELFKAMADHNAIAVGGTSNVWPSSLEIPSTFLTIPGRWSRWLGYWRRTWVDDRCLWHGR